MSITVLLKPPKTRVLFQKYNRREYKIAPVDLAINSCDKRYTFYHKVLVPLGHAFFNKKTGFWEFSEEYLKLLQTNLQDLQNWMKLIL